MNEVFVPVFNPSSDQWAFINGSKNANIIEKIKIQRFNLPVEQQLFVITE